MNAKGYVSVGARPTRVPTVKYERAKKAFEMRRDGSKFREIGNELGVSAERARQYVWMGEEWCGEGAAAPTSSAALSARAFNCLANYLWDFLKIGSAEIAPELYVTPERVATQTRAELLRQPNLGRGTLAEIEEWLESHGLRLADWGMPEQPAPPPNPIVVDRYVAYLRKHGWTVIPPEQNK